MTNYSIENFLKAIYKNSKKDNLVSVTKLSNELNISKAAITDMSKKLSEKGHIEYYRYKGVKLTSNGETLALKVIRKHRLWEMFLHKVLKMPWTEIHTEAEMLEHSTSDFLINKIDEFLGFPKFDPHGDPIPDIKLNMPLVANQIKLTEGIEKKKYKITRITENNIELLNYLSQIGLSLGSKIKFIKKLQFDGTILIESDGNNFNLSEKMAESIYIKETN